MQEPSFLLAISNQIRVLNFMLRESFQRKNAGIYIGFDEQSLIQSVSLFIYSYIFKLYINFSALAFCEIIYIYNSVLIWISINCRSTRTHTDLLIQNLLGAFSANFDLPNVKTAPVAGISRSSLYFLTVMMQSGAHCKIRHKSLSGTSASPSFDKAPSWRFIMALGIHS